MKKASFARSVGVRGYYAGPKHRRGRGGRRMALIDPVPGVGDAGAVVGGDCVDDGHGCSVSADEMILTTTNSNSRVSGWE